MEKPIGSKAGRKSVRKEPWVKMTFVLDAATYKSFRRTCDIFGLTYSHTVEALMAKFVENRKKTIANL